MKKSLICAYGALITVFVLLSLFIIRACTKYKYDYPEHFTQSYAWKKYTLVDANLTYLTKMDAAPGQKIRMAGTSYEFAAIRDVPSDTFLAAKTVYGNIITDLPEIFVYQNKKKSVKPIVDYTITSIELYYRSNIAVSRDATNRPDTIYNWGQRMHICQVAESSGATLIHAFRTTWEKHKSYQGSVYLHELKNGTTSDAYTFAIRVHFAEYDNLVWDADVYADDNGNFYLKINEIDNLNQGESLISLCYIKVTDELQKFLNESISKSNADVSGCQSQHAAANFPS